MVTAVAAQEVIPSNSEVAVAERGELKLPASNDITSINFAGEIATELGTMALAVSTDKGKVSQYINKYVNFGSYLKPYLRFITKLGVATGLGMIMRLGVELAINGCESDSIFQRNWYNDFKQALLATFGFIGAGGLVSGAYKLAAKLGKPKIIPHVVANGSVHLYQPIEKRLTRRLLSHIQQTLPAISYGLASATITNAMDALYREIEGENNKSAKEWLASTIFAGLSGYAGGRIAMQKLDTLNEIIRNTIVGMTASTGETFVMNGELRNPEEFAKMLITNTVTSYGGGLQQKYQQKTRAVERENYRKTIEATRSYETFPEGIINTQVGKYKNRAYHPTYSEMHKESVKRYKSTQRNQSPESDLAKRQITESKEKILRAINTYATRLMKGYKLPAGARAECRFREDEPIAQYIERLSNHIVSNHQLKDTKLNARILANRISNYFRIPLSKA